MLAANVTLSWTDGCNGNVGNHLVPLTSMVVDERCWENDRFCRYRSLSDSNDSPGESQMDIFIEGRLVVMISYSSFELVRFIFTLKYVLLSWRQWIGMKQIEGEKLEREHRIILS